MAAPRKKAPTFTTPAGTFKFPRLGTPDTKFKAEGEYSVKFIIAREAAAGLLAKLEPLHAAAIDTGKAEYAGLPVATRKKLDAKGGFTANPLFNVVYDDNEEETGEVEFVFKMAASGEYKSGPKVGQKWTRKPAVFDARMKPMAGDKVWGGTTGKVSFEVGLNKQGEPGYFIPGTGAAGLTLRLQAVQVIELVSGGQKTASAYGFGEEEGYADEGNAPADETDETGGKPAEAAGDGEQEF
jgi:hypothetical protein